MTGQVKFPHIKVQLSGQDGNAFAILSRVRRAMIRANVPQAQIDEYMAEAKSSNYDHLLLTTMKYVEVQ